jgi:hypothetical protein
MEKINSYWGHNGTHQEFVESLNAMIPEQGAVESPRGRNRRLEKFRQASNAYYDIFNNGGGNRGPLIRRIFNISVGSFDVGGRRERRINWTAVHKVVEPIMDQIILDAAVEQGLLSGEHRRGIDISGRLQVA